MSIKRKLFSSIISGIIIGFLIVAFPLIINLESQTFSAAPRAAIQTIETSKQYIEKEAENMTISTDLVPSLGETEKIEVSSLSSSSFYSLYYILLISILVSLTSFIIIKKYLRI